MNGLFIVTGFTYALRNERNSVILTRRYPRFVHRLNTPNSHLRLIYPRIRCHPSIVLPNLTSRFLFFCFLVTQEAGLPVGGADFNGYVMLEVHYNNPGLRKGKRH